MNTQAPPAWPTPTPPPKPKRHLLRNIAVAGGAAVLLLFVVALAAGPNPDRPADVTADTRAAVDPPISDPVPEPANSPAFTVTTTKCENAAGVGPTWTGTVDNPTPNQLDEVKVAVTFTAGTTIVERAPAYATLIPPGQNMILTATSFTEAPPGTLTCAAVVEDWE